MKSVNAQTPIANCELLGTDAEKASHVSQSTPLDCKRRELAEKKLTNPDENRERSRSTASKRRGAVRPL